MENINKMKRLVVLYIFWFLIISIIWLVGEYFLYGNIFSTNVKIAESYAPAAFVYALFLAVAFAVAQFILSPRPIQNQQQPFQTQQGLSETIQEPIQTEQTEEKEIKTEDVLSKPQKILPAKTKKKVKKKKK